MAIQNPSQIYQQNAVQTATPERLLVMLFDGAIRFMNLAKSHSEKKELDKAHNNLIKAQAIFSELMATLDMRYEIANQLLPLYEFCNRRLVDANLTKTIVPIDEVLELTQDLKQTWEEAAQIVKKSQGGLQW